MGLVKSAAATSKMQGTMSSSPSVAMAQAEEFDLLDQAAAAHVQLNMAELAENTGGFAVFSTNDFKQNMARIMEDVHAHYKSRTCPRRPSTTAGTGRSR